MMDIKARSSRFCQKKILTKSTKGTTKARWILDYALRFFDFSACSELRIPTCAVSEQVVLLNLRELKIATNFDSSNNCNRRWKQTATHSLELYRAKAIVNTLDKATLYKWARTASAFRSWTKRNATTVSYTVDSRSSLSSIDSLGSIISIDWALGVKFLNARRARLKCMED